MLEHDAEKQLSSPLRVNIMKMRLPTRNDVEGTVKLLSISVLIGCNSTSVAATDTTENIFTILKVQFSQFTTVRNLLHVRT